MIFSFKKPEPEIVASVDLGSNSFHMIVCRIQNGELIVVDRLREMVRLAAGIDNHKMLSDEAQQRALDCLARMGQRLRDLPHHCVRIVGTNTLRSAANSQEFIEKAEACLGHPIEIISGVEEARLIYLGVAHNVATNDERRLVMDIGGGSTELIVGEKFTPIYMESLYMGCVSMSRRFFADGVISNKAINKAEIAAEQELEPFITRYRNLNWKEAIGASGTIRAVAKIVQSENWADDGITFKSLKTLVDRLSSVKHINDLKLNALDPERAPVFAGGVMILYATFKLLQIEHMRVSDGALREGLIHDLLGRIHHEDIRSKSIDSLADRYHIDKEQAARVQKTAEHLFQQLANDWKLNDEHQQYLEWACKLYEIGLDIAHSNFQKHGAYIIENSDMAGFSHQEQKVLASMVLSHRRKIPIKVFKPLPKSWQEPSVYLMLILRLATLFHRSRTDVSENITVTGTKNSINLQIDADWLNNHSLTSADLQVEADYLTAAGFTLQIN